MLNKGKCEVFLFEYKPGHKAAEIIDNMSSSSGPGTAKKCSAVLGEEASEGSGGP